MLGTGGQIKKVSVIIHLSRPLKAFLIKFSKVFLILFCLIAVFVAKIDSPFTRSVRVSILDGYSEIASIVVLPVNLVSNFFQNIGDYFFVYSKNVELTKYNGYLERQLAILSQVKVENEHLKALLNFVDDKKYKFVSSKVIGGESGPFSRSIVINAGKKDGVERGLAVIGENGLVGRIIEVGHNSSQVLLLSDVNSRIPVISSLSRQKSILEGNNSEHPVLNYLPKDNSLKEGEEIITSGDGELFPEGLPVGLFYLSKSKEHMVKPYVKWDSLENLGVIKLIGQQDKDDGRDVKAIFSDPNSDYDEED